MDKVKSRVVLVEDPELISVNDALGAHHWQPRGQLLDVAFDFDGTRAREDDSEDEPVIGRNRMCSSLLQATGILAHIKVEKSRVASWKELCQFHDEEYLKALRHWESLDANALKSFNLVDDAAPFPRVDSHAAMIAGASLHAAHLLCNGDADITVNWCGGRHHAQRAHASGFCYVNDVVLAALVLQKHFQKVLCLDIDVHHGDGTEAAFLRSNKIFTCSFHQFEPGFFPGTGSPKEVGKGRGEGFNLNVPFQHGTCGTEFVQSFNAVVTKLLAEFDPKAVVLVCGADALRKDPRGGLLLDVSDIAACVRTLKRQIHPRPLLVLGGGGYNFAQVARCWVKVTAILADVEDQLPTEIPEHDFFEQYGPSWIL